MVGLSRSCGHRIVMSVSAVLLLMLSLTGCGETVKPVLYKTNPPSELMRPCSELPYPGNFVDDKDLAVWMNGVWDKGQECIERHKALVEFLNRSGLAQE